LLSKQIAENLKLNENKNQLDEVKYILDHYVYKYPEILLILADTNKDFNFIRNKLNKKLGLTAEDVVNLLSINYRILNTLEGNDDEKKLFDDLKDLVSRLDNRFKEYNKNRRPKKKGNRKGRI